MPERLPKTLRTRVAVERATSRCADCGHSWAAHNTARRICHGTPVCGCAAFEQGTPTPVQFDERYVDSPEPVDRKTR